MEVQTTTNNPDHVGSGHIARVVNPPDKKKYQHWTGARPQRGETLEGWVAKAQEHPGSWWRDWVAWLKRHVAREVPAREPGAGKFKAIEDAPGRYVKVRD